MLAGTIGCFWAGMRSTSPLSKKDHHYSLQVLGILYLACIPLFIFALISGCLTIDGIAFWIFIPIPSVFLGSAIGRFVRKLNLPYPKYLVGFILLFCAVGTLLIEFFTLPQVYFYNHIWGIWPGPIYDETVTLTGSFLFFRFITLLWIILLWISVDWNKTLNAKLLSGFIVISLIFSYLNLDNAGIISPTETIQNELGGVHKTEHFDLFYDREFYTEPEVRYWAKRHEFHFQQITTQLDIDWPKGRKIESYLYSHAWQKKKITGAKFTSYVPIWLEQDQLHIAKQQLDRVLKHELVHVISKQFGNYLFNGSWSIGLIEGLAEGIAKDASPHSTLHQIVAAESPLPDAKEMNSALSFTGFYSSAGSISYTTTGSFVEYLLNNYPLDHFKQAYQSATFKNTFASSFDELVNGWHDTLNETDLDSVDKQISEFIFAQRSLFQKDCPHSISKELKLWDNYNFLMASEDTVIAYQVLNDLIETFSDNALVKAEWIRSKLKMGKPDLVIKHNIDSDSLLNLNIMYADALFMAQGYEQATQYLSKFSEDISNSTAQNFKFTMELRQDSTQWDFLLDQRYSDNLVDEYDYLKMNTPNKLLTLEKALELKKYERVLLYIRLLEDKTISPDWFDIIEKAIHRTAFIGEFSVANELIYFLEHSNLRARYKERISEQLEWLTFLDNRSYIDQ
jgi:hypothetical protein